MKILFLTNNDISLSLAQWLKEIACENVIIFGERIDQVVLSKLKPDIIVSYNYRHIIRKEVISAFPKNIINLHISYLPYNRGSNPNFWSFMDNSPKGVTIHLIDEGLDTGDILIQKKIAFDESKLTFSESYQMLHTRIQELFKHNWENIKNGIVKGHKQIGKGSIHNLKDFNLVSKIVLKNGWETNVSEAIIRYNSLRNEK